MSQAETVPTGATAVRRSLHEDMTWLTESDVQPLTNLEKPVIQHRSSSNGSYEEKGGYEIARPARAAPQRVAALGLSEF